MSDEALANVRQAVRDVMKEEGMLELVGLKLAFNECQAKLDEAIHMMKEYQQQVDVYKSLAEAYKRELELLREKVTFCKDCVNNGDDGRS